MGGSKSQLLEDFKGNYVIPLCIFQVGMSPLSPLLPLLLVALLTTATATGVSALLPQHEIK